MKIDNETLVFEEEKVDNAIIFEGIVQRHILKASKKKEIEYWCSLSNIIKSQGVEKALEIYIQDLNKNFGNFNWDDEDEAMPNGK